MRLHLVVVLGRLVVYARLADVTLRKPLENRRERLLAQMEKATVAPKEK